MQAKRKETSMQSYFEYIVCYGTLVCRAPVWRRTLLSLLACLVCGYAARADDGMFPAAAKAKASIDYDGKGFLVNGKREFIASGSLHYSRVPRALWRDRLLRIKRAGFNTVETYAFWNYHEVGEGKWDFTGDKDFNAYLKLIKELGLYAIVRVGPYVCAEWDSGGYPVWLRFKPGVRVREDNPAFLAAVDKWFDKIMPIVAANQIHRGGAVILVQLENEHPQGWGREMPNGYFTHLRAKALALGLETPYFFSGLHHGHDPAGNTPWDSSKRANPWFTTEFWPGWYDLYGPLDARQLRDYDRGTWKILAYGGNGYNFYMLHGGTNFDTWNDDEVASNYDYGAAVGQAGDLRPIYYRFKRASLFARSFADVLENSQNDPTSFQSAVVGSTVQVTARRSPAGTILFADNPGNSTQVVTFTSPDGKSARNSAVLALAPGEIAALIRDYALTPQVTLESSACRILGIARQGDTTTLVVYNNEGGSQEERNQNPVTAGERVALQFRVKGGGARALPVVAAGANAPADVNASPDANALNVDAAGERIVVNGTFPLQGAAEYAFGVGKEKIRVLAVRGDLADRTYFADWGGKTYVIGGFEYVGDVTAKNGGLQIVTEQYPRRQPLLAADYFAYGPSDKPLKLQVVSRGVQSVPASFDPAQAPAPTLAPWQMRRADAEAMPAFLTADWKISAQPLQMGADGDTSAYAWYRTTTRVAKDGPVSLQFADSGDWIAVFVNGQRVPLPANVAQPRQRFTGPIPRAVSVPLKAGENTLAVLAAHYGRNKLFNHLGPLDEIAAKGLNGPVVLSRQPAERRNVTTWQWKPAPEISAANVPATPPVDISTSGTGWNERMDPGADVFQKQRGFAWFRATLDSLPGAHRKLHFEDVDDNATVYLNGKKVGAHQGWGKPFDIVLDSAWRASGPNQLVVLVENTDNTGGIPGAVELQASNPGDETPVRGWKMRGGIGDPMSGTGWKALAAPQQAEPKAAGVPAFYRTEFTATPPDGTGAHPIWRVTVAGLSRGFIWLNGHNLGRYPEKVPIKSLYLPECWLRKGANTLVVYDEEGSSPIQVSLVVEPATSRTVTEYAAE